MPESPASPTPYEVLGVGSSVSQHELRMAYRRLLRETHPDTGGSAARFHAVQLAWERVGDPADRAAYDRGHNARVTSPDADASSAAGTRAPSRSRPEGSSLRARSYGHPGGQARLRYLDLIREWVGRGSDIPDPYDPALVRSAPREIRYTLAKALAEEATARALVTLGIGYTIWNDVSTGRPGTRGGLNAKIDHVVLGPAGLFAIHSEDWGSEVSLQKGEVVGAALGDDEEPMHALGHDARTLARSLGVRFTGLAIVVPDESLAEPLMQVSRGRQSGAVLIRLSLLPQLLRNGLSGSERTSVDRVFELRTRLQNGIRFV
ncbi:MAG: molecular chaperone DnaJ [Microbacteriaceae bacterium]|nr:molecular chaperone DnaJ [Microbacteriaceae bacterium]